MKARPAQFTPQAAKKSIGTYYAPTRVLRLPGDVAPRNTKDAPERSRVFRIDQQTLMHTGVGHLVFMTHEGPARVFNPLLSDHNASVSILVRDGQRVLASANPPEVTDAEKNSKLFRGLIQGGVTLFSPHYEVEIPEIAWQEQPSQSVNAALETLGINSFNRIDWDKFTQCLTKIFGTDLTSLGHATHPGLNNLSRIYRLFRQLPEDTYELLRDTNALIFYPLFKALDSLEMTTASLAYQKIISEESDKPEEKYERIYLNDMLSAYSTEPWRSWNGHSILDRIRKEISLEAFLESVYVGALIGSDNRGPEVQALRTIVEAYWKKEGKTPFQSHRNTSFGARIIGWLIKH